jgi:hypothetical protein
VTLAGFFAGAALAGLCDLEDLDDFEVFASLCFFGEAGLAAFFFGLELGFFAVGLEDFEDAFLVILGIPEV